MTADSSKEEIIEAVLSGKKVHKISPAFRVPWTDEEIQIMARDVFETGQASKQQNRTCPPEIPAVNYLNQRIPGGILGWVNRVRTRHLFRPNPDIVRGGRIRPGSMSTRQVWREASKILLAEYRYWVNILQRNRQLMAQGRGYLVQYPKIGHLPFRCNDTFLGGEWSHFSSFWDSFIEELRLVFALESNFLEKEHINFLKISFLNPNFEISATIPWTPAKPNFERVSKMGLIF